MPIKPKLTFSGKRDNDYSITNVEFAIYPDPYDEESTIYDTKIGPHFFSNDN
ncbi:MAG: hypothetical protein PHP14_03645 [Candidatus Pacebacteria bacterium]|nr:hypothetical protein [Candidatus Paceibacterota bacterium]